MKNQTNAFIKNVKKYNLSQGSTFLLALSFVFLFSCMYYLGFIHDVTIENKNLYNLKDKISQLLLKDEILTAIINREAKSDSESGKYKYELLYATYLKSLEKLFNQISQSNLTEFLEFKEKLESPQNKNRKILLNFEMRVNNKISDNENQTITKIHITRTFILLNILLIFASFFNQVKKMNLVLQQTLKFQNEKDEAQEHMTIVGELTAGINHEIKNILCVAGLHSNQLSSKLKKQTPITPDEVLKSVQKIETSVSRAEKIIRSVSKLSYDSSNEEKKDCSVYEIFTETQEFAEYFAQKNEVELKIKSITARLKIHCHPIQISQVLLNLIKNSTEAIESLDEKWVELKAVWNEEKMQVIITVTDSGHGIPDAVRDKLFLKQFSTKAPGKGTGLGLSISAKIINDHGGEVYIDDNAQNTTFVVLLPALLTEPIQGFPTEEAS
jgi:signal transduction histidine kinase